MIEEVQGLIPFWMLLSASFGFLIGEAFGDSAAIASVSNKTMKIYSSNFKIIRTTQRICEAHSISSAASSMTSTSALSL